MTRTFTVPPTAEMGSFKGTCSHSTRESYRKNALWSYNSARAHDGLPPLDRMPAGTVYYSIRTRYINRCGDGQAETVDEFETRKEALAMVKEYRISAPTARFWVSPRACKGWKS